MPPASLKSQNAGAEVHKAGKLPGKMPGMLYDERDFAITT